MPIYDKIKISKNITAISGIFCVLVALLLLFNYLQFSKNGPIESKTIEALVERLHSDPRNEQLKDEIREFDLLARKAYFNSRWQVKTGAYLLLLGAIVFAINLRWYYSLKAKIEEPVTEIEDEITGRVLSQKWILISGVAVIALALVASFATVNHLDSYSILENNETVQQPGDNGIEVIEVGKSQAQIADVPQPQAGAIVADSVSAKDINPIEKTTEVKEEPALEEKATSVSNQEASPPKQVGANCNGFRGPLGQGVSYGKNIPTVWDGASGEKLLWKANIPKHGYNSPVISQDKIFLSGGDSKTRVVYCFDLNTGKLLWSKNVDNVPGSPASLPKVTEDTGLAAASVTTNGDKVVAIFANGDIICFDLDGKRIWARNLGVPANHYGHSSSLINLNGKVFVQYDTNRGAKILALNINTGETVWETVRTAKISWASPVLANIGGEMQVILTADPIVAGYNIETGEEKWSVECMMGEVGPSVAIGEGLVFAANEYARLAAINPETGTIVWEDDYYLPEVASPVCANGLVIVATSYGVMACYDAKDGKMLWEHDFGTSFYASPVVANNKIFAIDTDGTMHILELGREAKILSEPKLGENAYATPAFAEGKIIIRGMDNLYCFGK